MMTEAELIRGVWPPSHAMKRLSRMIDVPIETARHLLYRRFTVALRQEFARKLLLVMDEQDRRRAEIRRQLQRMADGDDGEESAELGNPACGVVPGYHPGAADQDRLGKVARRLVEQSQARAQ